MLRQSPFYFAGVTAGLGDCLSEGAGALFVLSDDLTGEFCGFSMLSSILSKKSKEAIFCTVISVPSGFEKTAKGVGVELKRCFREGLLEISTGCTVHVL